MPNLALYSELALANPNGAPCGRGRVYPAQERTTPFTSECTSPVTPARSTQVKYSSAFESYAVPSSTSQAPLLPHASRVRARNGRFVAGASGSLHGSDTRSCAWCLTTETTQWRIGCPGGGPLCNACGINYRRALSLRNGVHIDLDDLARAMGPARPSIQKALKRAERQAERMREQANPPMYPPKKKQARGTARKVRNTTTSRATKAIIKKKSATVKQVAKPTRQVRSASLALLLCDEKAPSIPRPRLSSLDLLSGAAVVAARAPAPVAKDARQPVLPSIGHLLRSIDGASASVGTRTWSTQN